MMIDQKTFARYASDPAAFRADLLVDVDGVVRRFGDVQDDWQRADFAALDPALLRCTGRKPEAKGPGRAYLERGRGHSKTTDLAVTCCWAMAFATRPLRGFAYAADKDQARLLRDAMQTITRLNPWLAGILAVEAHRVVNVAAGHPGEGGTLTIEASDVGSSYGILPDLIIADEIVHWEGDGALWESLISSAAKRANCFLAVISNAGFADSWQWKVREAARVDPGWYFSRLEGPRASWLTPDRLAEQRRMLPPVAYARLWENQWSTGGGDALTEADIAAAFKPDLSPMPRQAPGWEFVAGLDLGVSRDASAVCLLGVHKRNCWEADRADHGRIRLAYTRLWKPQGRKVDLQEVEDALLALHFQFELKAVAFDPWQATHMSQRLSLSHLPMQEVTPTGQNLQRIATVLIESFNDRRVDLYEDADLRRDLRRMRVEERSYGFRLVSPHDVHGHSDLGTAFSLAMLAASERAGQPTAIAGMYASDEEGIEAEHDALMARRVWSQLILEQHGEHRFP